MALGAVGLGWVGCQSPASVPGTGVPTQCQQVAPAIQPVKTDILFVVDNSGSMAENQQKVATDLPVFVAELQKSGGVLNSFRVGVTTTSVYSAYEYFNSVAYYYYPQGGWLTGPPPRRALRASRRRQEAGHQKGRSEVHPSGPSSFENGPGK